MNERRLYPSRVLHGQVAHQIGREIVSGEIREGDFLPRESELAERFDVSRQAIREALKVLTAKGLVGSRRRTGTFVLPRAQWNLFDPDVLAWHPPGRISAAFMSDIIELRRVLEPEAAALAARRGAPDRLAAIATALEEMKQHISVDKAAFDAADANFHVAIFAASGNDLVDRLGAMIGPLLGATLGVQSVARQTDDETMISMHAAVYSAIAARDPQRARRDMERILEIATTEVDRIAPRAQPGSSAA